MAELPDKIQKLKEIHLGSHADAKAQIETWEKETTRLLQTKAYAENKITIRLIDELKRRVAQIEMVLKNDRKATDVERATLFERMDSYIWFLKLFDPKLIQDRLDSIDQAVEYELTPNEEKPKKK